MVQPVLTDEVHIYAIRINRDIRKGTEDAVNGCIRERTSVSGLHDLLDLLGSVVIGDSGKIRKFSGSGRLNEVISVRGDHRVWKRIRSDGKRDLLLEICVAACRPVTDNLDIVIIKKVPCVLVIVDAVAVRKRCILRIYLIAIMNFDDMIKFLECAVIVLTRGCIIRFIGSRFPDFGNVTV